MGIFERERQKAKSTMKLLNFFVFLYAVDGAKRRKPVANTGDAALPKSCHEIFLKNVKNNCKKSANGFYRIKPTKWLKPKWAECVFDYERGWTVVQSRYNGKELFERPFRDYKVGFGCPIGDGRWDATDCLGEVWLGLDYWFWVQRSFGKAGAKLCNYIASGDTQRTYEYVCYEKFLITGAKDSFRIAKIADFNDDMTKLKNGFRGGVDGAKGPHDLLGAKFSAIDSDNDKTSARHCAKESHSGWWFNGCAGVNLNGDWSGEVGRGIFWDDANTAVWDDLKYSKMFIGPTRSQEWCCLHGKQ